MKTPNRRCRREQPALTAQGGWNCGEGQSLEVSEGTDDAPARLIERKRRTALPGALGALLPRSGAVLPRVRDALTMFVVIVVRDGWWCW
jgi:hypothetical protein